MSYKVCVFAIPLSINDSLPLISQALEQVKDCFLADVCVSLAYRSQYTFSFFHTEDEDSAYFDASAFSSSAIEVGVPGIITILHNDHNGHYLFELRQRQQTQWLLSNGKRLMRYGFEGLMAENTISEGCEVLPNPIELGLIHMGCCIAWADHLDPLYARMRPDSEIYELVDADENFLQEPKIANRNESQFPVFNYRPEIRYAKTAGMVDGKDIYCIRDNIFLEKEFAQQAVLMNAID